MSPEPRAVQNVTAVSGFAYGVIGADIHVFSNGLPLYLLANWHPMPEADSTWLRELPSRMLNARRAVVPFTGRDGELAQLRQWRDSQSRPLAVRWLHGPGGYGKTRLAEQFAAESIAAGWKVIAAFHGPDADRPQPESQDMRMNGEAGLLLIVDYADRWLPTNLTWLFKNTLLHQAGVPTRVLMIARTANAWPSVRAILDSYQAATSSQELLGLPPGSAQRADMFVAARDSFALVYGLPAPDAHRLEPPDPLSDAGFGLTLTLHMAALVAVDSRVTGTRPQPGIGGLTAYLLDREQLHWTRLFSDGMARSLVERAGYRTPPEVMNQVVFAAALTGALHPDEATTVLAGLELPHPQQLLADHTFCYPPADRGRAALEPLYPDRLAEDFLALTLPGHDADYPAQPWASATAIALLERRGTRREPAPWTPRAITFLASAAQRWSHLGTRYLYPLLLGDPQLALDAGNAALTAIAELSDLTTPVLAAIEERFPDQRHADLDTGIAALSTRIAERVLATADNLEELARVKNDHAVRLSRAGHYHRAVGAALEAVAAARRLAAQDAAHDAYLAGALNNLGACLSEVNRWEDAVAAAQEAIAIQRRLAATDSFYEFFLAASLSSLSANIMSLGRPQEALAAAQEAVDILRRPSRADPADHQEALGTSLFTLAASLAGVGKSQKALAAVQEAEIVSRRLAKANPAAYEPVLAASLVNLGIGWSGVRRSRKALAASGKAVALLRRLAKANATAHEPDLAASLANLAVDQWQAGLREESVSSNREAVILYRRSAKTDPIIYQPLLAASLSDLGGRLSELQRPDQALIPAREAVELGRRLAAEAPAQLPDFAMALDNLAIVLGKLGITDQAVTVEFEAVRVYRELAETSPAASEPELAHSLSSLGARLASLERWNEALAVAEEAVSLDRRLTETDSGREPDLARSIFNLARIYSALNRPADAVPLAEEAVAAYRTLSNADLAAHESGLAISLNNLSADLARLGRGEEALSAMTEVVSIRRRQAEATPGAEAPSLAQAQDNLGVLLSELERHEEALAVTADAVSLWRRMAESDGRALELRRARSLWIYAQARASCHTELDSAFSSIKDACAIHRRWDGTLPEEYSGDPAGALSTAVSIMRALGLEAESVSVTRLIQDSEFTRAQDHVCGLRDRTSFGGQNP